MWIFSKNGHLSIGQHAGQRDILVVHAQLKEEMESFVALLDEIGGQKHEVQDTAEGDYRFVVLAQRSAVAQTVARMVAGIDYGKLIHSFHVDFGAQPGYLLWLNKAGLQVATVRS
jgi:hypothetical protein